MRYCDDIVILHNSKNALKNLLNTIKALLIPFKLTVKNNHQVYPIKRNGIDFMGFVFHRATITLRKRIERSFRKDVKAFYKAPSLHFYQSLASYNGWVKTLTDGLTFWNKIALLPLDDFFCLI